MSQIDVPAPETWEDAAIQAMDQHTTLLVEWLQGKPSPWCPEVTENLPTLVAALEAKYADWDMTRNDMLGSVALGAVKDELVAHANHDDWDTPCARNHLHELVWVATELQGGPVTVYDVLDIITSKQRDYGHDNINAFGLNGIAVRVSDKIARYKNLVAAGRTPENETIADTLIDLAGYGIIGLMVMNGTFDLELEVTS